MKKLLAIVVSILGFASGLGAIALILFGIYVGESNRYERVAIRKAAIEASCEPGFESIKKKMWHLATDASSVGAVVEYYDGRYVMVAHVTPNDAGFASLYGRNGWAGAFTIFTPLEEACSIKSITTQLDLGYSEKKELYLKYVGRMPTNLRP